MKIMAYTFLIYEFGGNEEAAQQARHKIDSWKQGFRLGSKLVSKFERTETAGEPAAKESAAKDDAAPAKTEGAKAKEHGEAKSHAGAKKGKHSEHDGEKGKGKDKEGAKSHEHKEDHAAAPAGNIRMFVRLDFSDHEKLSYQRWIERIPKEEPFQGAHGKIVRQGEPGFTQLTDQFDSLS